MNSSERAKSEAEQVRILLEIYGYRKYLNTFVLQTITSSWIH